MNRPLTIKEWFESLGKMVEEFDWEGNGMSEQDKAAPVEQTICLNPVHNETICSQNQDFYTHNTQPKQWVGLTEEEIETIRTTGNIWTAYDISKAVEAKLKEKNT